MNDIGPDSKLSGSHWRDPVALLVEEQLSELAQGSGTEVHFDSSNSGDIEVRFETFTIRGENRDIALLRLASALLDDNRFAPTLIHALRSPVGKDAMEGMS
jgi:hypothetical protein